ncbi:MAG: aminotransferase class I/II-fold pyridoxal phosphate-dependent enzyme, partial [Pseudomonadota bacterium]|nr:aminotransferase class I/II-fold pyridoxal phosphate-dependent enzyme [Pseudomonadota bacterium]
ERRDYIVKSLNDCKGITCLEPKGAFYVYPSCSGIIGKKYKEGSIIKNDSIFSMLLLKEKLVSVVQGEAFGLSPYFRISYATSLGNLKIACERIKEFCEELI